MIKLCNEPLRDVIRLSDVEMHCYQKQHTNDCGGSHMLKVPRYLFAPDTMWVPGPFVFWCLLKWGCPGCPSPGALPPPCLAWRAAHWLFDFRVSMSPPPELQHSTSDLRNPRTSMIPILFLHPVLSTADLVLVPHPLLLLFPLIRGDQATPVLQATKNNHAPR